MIELESLGEGRGDKRFRETENDSGVRKRQIKAERDE